MATQNNSKELMVTEADIESDLKGFGIVKVAGVVVVIDDRTIEGGETGTTSSSDGATSGVKVEFGDGNVTNTMILVPVTHAMSVPTGDLDSKKKDEIKNKADQSKKEKERDGIGE